MTEKQGKIDWINKICGKCLQKRNAHCYVCGKQEGIKIGEEKATERILKIIDKKIKELEISWQSIHINYVKDNRSQDIEEEYDRDVLPSIIEIKRHIYDLNELKQRIQNHSPEQSGDAKTREVK